MDAGTWGQIITFATVLAGFYHQWKREGRQREWDMADRKVIKDKIEENTQISRDAFHEANGAKILIAGIEDKRNKMAAKQGEVIDDIKDGTAAVKGAMNTIMDNTTRSADALTKLAETPLPVVPVERRKNPRPDLRHDRRTKNDKTTLPKG